LRLLEPSDQAWLSRWETGAQSTFPSLELFAIDAFGAIYGLDEKGDVSIIWTETGGVESLGITEQDFYSMINDDPNATINQALYLEAVQKYGRPGDDQIFALRVETALGGALVIGNIFLKDISEQMLVLGKIAKQIGSDALGTVYGVG
jgi:hypothetical protein